MARRETMKINAPKDIMFNLRIKFPRVRDADLIRMVYGTSLARVELGLDKLDKRLVDLLNVKKKKGKP